MFAVEKSMLVPAPSDKSISYSANLTMSLMIRMLTRPVKTPTGHISTYRSDLKSGFTSALTHAWSAPTRGPKSCRLPLSLHSSL